MTFDRVVVLCMSELKIHDLEYIELMTLREFNYRMYSLEYERLKQELDIYKLAFAIRDAQAEQKKIGGKKGESEYVYKSADEIVHYETNIKRLNRGEAIKFGDESRREESKPSVDLLKQIAEINR